MGRNNITGAWGEAVAAEFLRKKHYTLIASGYRCRFGEIDLIMCDRKHLIFVEVKLRKSANFANASDFVDARKQSRIRNTASMYLAQNPTKLQPRFDVVAIYAPEGVNTLMPTIHHLEGAFE